MAIGYVDPNFPNPMGPNDATIIIYGYTPSKIVALLGIILFGLSFIAHSIQLIYYRAWYFTPVVIGLAMEIVGYAFRYLSSQVDPYSVIYFVVQYFFIVVAPVLFSASIYTILSKMIKKLGRQYSPIPPKAILWTFITCDIIATIIQVAGAALIGSKESNGEDPTTANNILLAGLAFQVFDFLIFIVLMSMFLWKARSAWNINLKAFVCAVALAAIMVYLRTCFRLAETAQGLFGALSTHEVFFGCLEFAPIVIAVGTLNIWYPGRVLKMSTNSTYPEMVSV